MAKGDGSMRMQKRSIVTPCCGKRFRHIFERGATSIIYDCECGKRYKLNFFKGKYGKTGKLFYKMILEGSSVKKASQPSSLCPKGLVKGKG
jgi:hypothetical protein